MFLLGGTLFAGLVDPLIADDNREWWARSAGYFLILAAAWVILGSICLGIPQSFEVAKISLAKGLELFNPKPVSGIDASLGFLITIVSGTLAYYTRIAKELTSVAKS